ncbi:hypothetical protein C7445_109128 [Alicyclobacillus sacchari]|uniref:Uncharacterized protein n=1 Tax=Alicyclobacillus sacchari TaxID=392010 RepID=A0A4R8LMS1_9BACL|nr:hypothetical protein C7445_109128 [Alicyclobacillus sacchari]
MSVSELVLDCRNGNREAWTALVDLFRPKSGELGTSIL